MSASPDPSAGAPEDDAQAAAPPPEDALAPEHLVARYGERIFRLARRITGNDADAEDVTQATLIKILRKRDTFRGESDPMGWIYRIAVNEAREHHRRRARRPALSLESLPIELPDEGSPRRVSGGERAPGARMADAELDDLLQRAIQALPDMYREAVVLHDVQGLPYAEAARLLDLSLGGFKVRLHRARLRLREHVRHQAGPELDARMASEAGGQGA